MSIDVIIMAVALVAVFILLLRNKKSMEAKMEQDYDHMMTVGLIYCGGELPIMVSGYAKYMDVDESFDKDSVAGNS